MPRRFHFLPRGTATDVPLGAIIRGSGRSRTDLTTPRDSMLNGLAHQIPSGAAVQVSSPMPTTTEVGVLIAAKAEAESKLIV